MSAARSQVQVGAPLAAPLAVDSTAPSIRPRNRLQRDVSATCIDCGAPVRRARRARGPLPSRCPACTTARRPRAQLRAYLRAAVRLAEAESLAEVRAATQAALTVFDAAETAR